MTNAEIIAGDNPLDGLKDDWGSASKYLSMFIDDAQHTLDEITDALLALEAGGGRENVQRLFVAVHRLKGSAASIGLRRTAKLAHLAEDLLQELVDNGREFSSKTGNSLLTFADGLRTCIEAMRRGSPEEDQFNVVVHELLAARQALEGDGLWERGDSPPLSVPQAVSDAAVAKTAAADRDRPISSTVHVAPGPVARRPRFLSICTGGSPPRRASGPTTRYWRERSFSSLISRWWDSRLGCCTKSCRIGGKCPTSIRRSRTSKTARDSTPSRSAWSRRDLRKTSNAWCIWREFIAWLSNLWPWKTMRPTERKRRCQCRRRTPRRQTPRRRTHRRNPTGPNPPRITISQSKRCG